MAAAGGPELNMLKIIDTHFHLPSAEEKSFEDFEAQFQNDIRRAAEALSVSREEISFALVAAGGDYTESCRAKEYAAIRDNVRYSCGVHPHQAENHLAAPQDFNVFKNDPKLCAIGEIGLDYFYEKSPVAEQRQVFEEFLQLALDWNLPAMLHIRDKDGEFNAGNDALERLSKFAAAGGRFVIHCCTIPEEKIGSFLDLGAMIGVTGMITFKRAENVRSMLKKVPNDRLMLETDAPYLAPIPFRGGENSPGLLPLAAQMLAVERGMSLAELCELTTANAENFYFTAK